LIRFTEKQAGKVYGTNDETDLAFRVIADHSRALQFMIADGVVPSNEGRGYVLRRVLRRAARHAKVLGFDEPYLYKMSEPVIGTMGDAYPELIERRAYIEEVIRTEEERFVETLDKGLSLLTREREALRKAGGSVLSGDVAFRLYDTFGFPLDMTEDILRTDGIQVDVDGFQSCMAQQRLRAREARRAGPEVTVIDGATRSRFVGDRTYEYDSEISALSTEDRRSGEAREGDHVQIVTPETPFYGESGGQVGDRGTIEAADGSLVEITDAQKPHADATVHIGRVVRGSIAKGTPVHLSIDRERRDAVRLNHSVTHILHAVLRRVLGDHVRQAGSLVAPDRLRFDFNHGTAIEADKIERIEEEVNAHIRENAEVRTDEMAFDDAIKAGALAFFGDKYGDRVRVVRMGEFSTELCGGTHVQRSGDIGVFKLRGESGVAAGTRRIEAMTGISALEWIQNQEQTLRQVGSLLRGSDDDLGERVERLLSQQRELEKQVAQLQRQITGNQSGDLLSKVRTVRGKQVLATEVEVADPKALLELADQLRERMGSGVIVLASRHDGQVRLLAAVTKDLAKQVHAGKLISQVAPILGGKGGGRPELAQAGGNDPSKIQEALDQAVELVP
jgi:alanyl-tRNA synthetase